MASMLRSSRLLSNNIPRIAKTTTTTTQQMTTTRIVAAPFQNQKRHATQSYGNVQSGHQQGVNEPNPKRHLEHPGPEAPAATGKDQNAKGGKSKGLPKEPYSSAEETDPEVKKHNDEMRQRADRSANQLGEEDNKVDKKFWKGDVGDMSQEKK